MWFIFDALSNAPPTRASGAGLAEISSILDLFHEGIKVRREISRTKIHLLPDLGNSRHLASPPSTSSDRPRGSCGHSILGCPDVNDHPGAGCLRGLLEQCALEVGLHYYHARASVTTTWRRDAARADGGRARDLLRCAVSLIKIHKFIDISSSRSARACCGRARALAPRTRAPSALGPTTVHACTLP